MIASIMAEQISDVTGGPRSPDPVSSSGPSRTPYASGHSVTPLHGREIYKPLPVGCWTIPFHGNCPRCHHYHRAVEVQIKVTDNPGQVSYVHCEHCEDKWAAFGGRNSTKVSLLSTGTAEPDSIEEGVRYSLIDIVKMATERARLGALNESQSPTAFRQPSINAHVNEDTHHTSTIRTEVTIPPEAAQQYQRLEPARNSFTKHDTAAKHRSSAFKLLSRIKVKVTGHFITLHRGSGQDPSRLSHQPRMTGRQFEKSPIRAPRASNSDNGPTQQVSAAVPTSDIPINRQASTPEIPGVQHAHPTTRLSEVVAFIRDLDKPMLESMSEDERDRWMRTTYTDFKARKRGSAATQTLSPIGENSIANEASHSLGYVNRRSNEIRGAGAHIEGLELVQLHLRRSSLATSDLMDDTLAPDNSTSRSTPQHAVRPRSQQLQRVIDLERAPPVPNAPPSPQRWHQRGRGSFDSRTSRRADSISSLRVQPASLWSQGSTTVHGSTTTLHQTGSQETVRQPESSEELDTQYADLQPPRPSFLRNDSDSPPPPSTPRESFESTRRV